jgi:phage shock protein PspC (stress-responsive transcriptional regulator)/heme/copper-type cytochrome/quinol oxidase subunit 2
MKRVININFQGRVIPIEESAYDVLKQYVESLRRHFANEEGRDEIINDIEGRVAELFGETLKKGATCITDDDVNKIIDSMGRPEDFEAEEASVKQQLGGEQKQQQSSSSSQSQQQQSYAYSEGPRRLYRDENHKVLGGVCSGLANYFGIDITVARVLFVIFFGITFIPYLILWVAVPSTSTTVIGGQRKRLFRDGEDKVIAGVCSGLSQYFGVSVWIPRLLFLIPFFSFVFRWGHWGVWDFPHFLNVTLSPGSIFVYVILWLVLPEAKTTADKLEMKGEKVDLNNIKNTIQNDMEGFGQRAKKWGEEMGQKATEFGATVGQKGAEMGRDAATFTKKGRTTFGDVIVLLFKIFAYFIIGCVLFSIVAGLFAAGVALTGLMPAFGYVINEGWQTVFLWGTVILFIWVPVIGIVTFIIRRLAKMRGNSNVIRYSFLALWLIGLFCFIGLLSSLHDDFKYRNNATEENVTLSNPGISKLEVKIEPFAKYYHYDWFKIEPFTSFDEDTVFVRNIRVRIVKSRTDSFQVKMVKLSNGKSKQQADELVSKIDFDATQMDSVLMLSKGIAINKKDKFRNQHIVLTIAVPVGKKILITERVGWDHNVQLGFNDYGDWWEMDREDEAYRWDHNTEYIMTEKGLERTHKKKSRRNDDNDDNDAVEKFKKSREDLQKQYDDAEKEAEEKRKKAEELKKELEKPVVDSTRYKYTPEKPKKATAVPKTTTQAETNIGMNNLLMMRFPI